MNADGICFWVFLSHTVSNEASKLLSHNYPKFIHTANKPLENVSIHLSEASPYTVLSLQCCSLHLLEINSAKTFRISWNAISLG